MRASAAVYYGGAYYLGKYRGLHDWTNFAASGGAAGLSLSLYMIRPLVPRTIVFGTAFGMLLGSAGSYALQVRVCVEGCGSLVSRTVVSGTAFGMLLGSAGSCMHSR